MDWQIRPYQSEDLPRVVEVVRAREAAYHLGSVMPSDEVLWRMQGPGGTEARPAFVVIGPHLDGVAEGGLLGAGALSCEGSAEGDRRSYILHFFGHPAGVDLGVEDAIVARLFEILRELESQPGMSKAADVRAFAGYREEMPGRKELFERAGMTFTRQFLKMERSLAEPIESPALVEGVNIRTYRRPEDNRGACEAYNNSFSDHWDHHDETIEGWDNGIASPSRRSDLSWLAEVDGEPGKFGGFCICVVHEEANRESGSKEGWIELLGTTREWRGKGLGRSLLLHGLHSLKSAGLDTALLSVDSESPTGANLLYEKVGFRVRSRDLVYSVKLEDVRL